MTYDNSNSGTLGKNKRKEKDTHPDYAGQVNVDGKDYWLSGWVKENKSTGEKFFSLSLRAKDQQQAPASTSTGGGGFDDDIPFAPFEAHSV